MWCELWCKVTQSSAASLTPADGWATQWDTSHYQSSTHDIYPHNIPAFLLTKQRKNLPEIPKLNWVCGNFFEPNGLKSLQLKHEQNCRSSCTQSPPASAAWPIYFTRFRYVCGECAFHWFLFAAYSAHRATIKFRVTFTPMNHRRGRYCFSFSALLSPSQLG